MGRTESDTPVTAAIHAARWIREAAVDDDLGHHWLANPDVGGKSANAGHSATLYSGAAGIVLFHLELATATGDQSYLDEAIAGADHLVTMSGSINDPTFYHGLMGLVFALTESYWATGDATHQVAAERIAERVLATRRPSSEGTTWTGDVSQRGDGGIALGLLHIAGMLGRDDFEKVAIATGRHIAGQVVPGHQFGVESGDLPVDAVTPGFLSGTAGSGFLMARLYGVTGDGMFLAAARRAADFVRMVSSVSDKCALVPHHVPHARALNYLGFCSGSAGVARLFHELYRVTGDPGDLDWVERLARGVINSGVPERRSEGYWNVACQCCGAAGLVEFFVGLWAATGTREYLDVAGELGDDLIERATRDDGRGMRWYQAYRRLRPHEITADTGYMVGAAGIGVALLHLAAAREGRDARRVILLPDNPFPAIPVPADSL
ncbi:lanthionine synthetase LanC family protein [Herbidospora mongoliensis]|uniref:lanthionine synthetase LanC family protein n=1 Tax=Herbidospora mongoliensis TaxID=688067 RepID=UPI000837A17F|nr:lanthionine synthetase LanC family protein [Herbidospora mongoliensis]